MTRMSFADLRKARNARQAALVKTTTVPAPSKPSESQQEHESAPQNEETSESEPYVADSGLYSALGPSFEIRIDPSMGRGIYVKHGLSTAVKAGE